MKKVLLVFLGFPLLVSLLVIAGFGLYFVDNVREGKDFLALNADNLASKNEYEFYAALPQVLGSFTTTVEAADARPELIKNYLNKYNSPLLPFSDLIVSTADKYGIDYRLVVSIAQCESNVCKVIPNGSYNCWGFENGATHFGSFENAIDRVSKTLKEGYIDKGLITPAQIMPKYAPPSVVKGGPWAKCVQQFMDELQ